jgi:hypothetical protein
MPALPLAPQTPSANLTPTPEPDLYPFNIRSGQQMQTSITIGPTPLASLGPTASPGPPAPVGTPTLAPPEPGMARVTADQLFGKSGGDIDAAGNVDVRYGDADILADRAHYDSQTKIIQAVGHVRYVAANGDTATAESLEYDTNTDVVTMDGVQGQTSAVVYQGEQIHGFAYYKGRRITLDKDGHSILEDGWLTTCDLRHVAYHITGRVIEVRPNDRIIARSSHLYLGRLLVAALGYLVIPITPQAERRPSFFAPRIGYNSVYGFFLKNYINYYRSPFWYGTYHVDLYQKAGLGLGADLYFARRDGRGSGEFTFYNIHSTGNQIATTGVKNSFQANLNVQQALGRHVTASVNAAYQSQTALSSIPSTTSANVNVVHNGARSTTTYGVTLTSTGPNHSTGGLFSHTIAFSPVFSENISFNFQDSIAPPTFSRSYQFMSDAHYTARAFDADLVTQTLHGDTSINNGGAITTTPVFGFQKVPELTVRGRPFIVPSLRLPVNVTLIEGVYNDAFDNFVTSRQELNAQLGGAVYRIGNSATVTAQANLRQDSYGTGDLRGAYSEQYSLQKFFGQHADDTLTYSAQSVRGFTPLQSYDLLSGYDQVSDVLNVYNGSAYRFTTSTTYDFRNKFLGSINYQLNVTPSPTASLILGDSYDPHGSGYGPLSITLSSPLGRNDYLQFLGDYDFRLHGLQGQNYFLTHTVNDCYQIRLAYRQPLHEVDLSISLLAFPSQGVNFGLNGRGSILPQSFGQ